MSNELTKEKLLEYQHLPGGEILERGLWAINNGIIDENSLLLTIGAYRLNRHGFNIVPLVDATAFPEDQLYALLVGKYKTDAYRHYQNLIRRLVSLENALDCV
jgi:hypothetical protein